MNRWLTILAATVAIAACGKAQTPPAPAAVPAFDLAAARTVIESNNQRFTQAHVTGDQALIDAMFTADAKSLPPGADPVVGRDAISVSSAPRA